MRAYAPLSEEQLEALAAGGSVSSDLVIPVSEDEDDELDALESAADSGRVVAAVDVASESTPITIADVASFHLDADGSRFLAWYATQELDAILQLIRR